MTGSRKHALWLSSGLGLLALVVAGGTTLATRAFVPPADALPMVSAGPGQEVEVGVSARGRIEPLDGLLRISGPSGPSTSVVAELFVDEGQSIRAGELLATTDNEPFLSARVQEAEAELRNAEREFARARELRLGAAVSDADRDRRETNVAVARAKLMAARAELVRARITSPVAGLVVEIHAYPGERIGPEGLLEIARIDRMYAIAEVYETDVGRVRPGRAARITSPALPGTLTGRVEWIRPKVEKQDEIGTDPAARKDARVVEVKVVLDDSAAAAPFTNLQVGVEIEP